MGDKGWKWEKVDYTSSGWAVGLTEAGRAELFAPGRFDIRKMAGTPTIADTLGLTAGVKNPYGSSVPSSSTSTTPSISIPTSTTSSSTINIPLGTPKTPTIKPPSAPQPSAPQVKPPLNGNELAGIIGAMFGSAAGMGGMGGPYKAGKPGIDEFIKDLMKKAKEVGSQTGTQNIPDNKPVDIAKNIKDLFPGKEPTSGKQTEESPTQLTNEEKKTLSVYAARGNLLADGIDKLYPGVGKLLKHMLNAESIRIKVAHSKDKVDEIIHELVGMAVGTAINTFIPGAGMVDTIYKSIDGKSGIDPIADYIHNHYKTEGVWPFNDLSKFDAKLYQEYLINNSISGGSEPEVLKNHIDKCNKTINDLKEKYDSEKDPIKREHLLNDLEKTQNLKKNLKWQLKKSEEVKKRSLKLDEKAKHWHRYSHYK